MSLATTIRKQPTKSNITKSYKEVEEPSDTRWELPREPLGTLRKSLGTPQEAFTEPLEHTQEAPRTPSVSLRKPTASILRTPRKPGDPRESLANSKETLRKP